MGSSAVVRARVRMARAVARLETRDFACYLQTFQKTGTKWMQSVFVRLSRHLAVPVVATRHIVADPDLDPVANALEWCSLADRRRVLVVDSHEGHGRAIMAAPRFRGICVIRDPRDQVLSATAFHLRGFEKGMLEPEARFDGRSYFEAINAQPTLRQQILFELRHHSRIQITQMVERLETAPPNLRIVRYEDLMTRQLEEFSALFSFLGLHGVAHRIALFHARQNSLWGSPAVANDPHVRSGEVAQWRQTYDQDLAEAFLREHPSALDVLGYDEADRWVAGLPRRRAELDAPTVAHGLSGELAR